MALDNKRSVYEIAIEIGGKLKQSLGTATSGANKKLSGLAVYADKTAKATTSLSKAINGMMLLKGASWGGGHLVSIGKSAITAASEMETYRTTLNTVLRDEEKAADMMRWSTEFAAHTPYNTGDIVDAVTRLEAYGFKSQVMLENIGNMASAMNKDLPTAVEAVYKATLGEMELMENNFAITKKLINEKAQEWYGQAVIDASKKITDTEMYTNTLLRLIEEKFEGGMEAQSKTWAGIKSNMEDSRDAIFRRIVGMDAAGEATENGLYARMLRMGQKAADSLSAFADAEILDQWAEKLGNSGEKMLGAFEKLGGTAVPAIVTGVQGLWGGVKNVYSTADLLVEKLINGEGIAEGILSTVELAAEGVKTIGTAAEKTTRGDLTGAVNDAGMFLYKGIQWLLGEDNLITRIIDENTPRTEFVLDEYPKAVIEGSKAQVEKLKGKSFISGIKSFTTPGTGMPTMQTFSSGAIQVNVTAAPTDNAYTLGDVIAEKVKTAISETAHNGRRTSLNPNRTQTAY